MPADPVILATWTFGRDACAAGWPVLAAGGAALDAVESACRAVEDDPRFMTVGRGGYPDAAGEVTLDASIMVSPSRAGGVCFVRRLAHPVSIARRVMDATPHVMLAGDGAERFAREQGFAETDLLTPDARAAWEEWLRTKAAPAAANVEEARPRGAGGASRDAASGEADHDTVGVLAMDAAGRMAGACSTSGLRFKRPGRVGDSPVIGHGLYVDPAAGAAVATGRGELVMGVCGTFLAVEAMRGGASPEEAAAAVIRRIVDVYDLLPDDQACVIALAPDGRWSSAALRPGFRVAVHDGGRDELVDAAGVLLP